MATGKITKSSVDAIQPGGRDSFLWDDEVKGFGLKVTPAGVRTYVLQYRTGGRGSPTKRYTIGKHGTLTPKRARDEAERLATLVRQGKDPAADKREARYLAVDLAFDAFAQRFLEQYVRTEWRASYGFAESILRLHVTPHLRAKPLHQITRADLFAVFDAIPATSPALRRNVYAVVRRLFRWAIGRGIERSPLDGFEAPSGPPSRDRVLTDAELRLMWLASSRLGYPFGDFYQLLAATGQRREEVAGLNWRELDRGASEWLLPSGRAKNGVASLIPLSVPAIAVLDRLAGSDKWPKRGLVFTTTGQTAVSGYSRAKRRLDAAMLALARKEAVAADEDPEDVELVHWRVHDLRRTVATGLQRLGVRFEVTEAVLNHVSGSKSGVAGVYQRHDWKDEKREALNRWAVHLLGLAAGGDESNVVPLLKRKA